MSVDIDVKHEALMIQEQKRIIPTSAEFSSHLRQLS